MKVTIKDFDVAMEVKNNGIELEISDTQGAHLGDLFVTKAKLIWCEWRKRRENGKEISWNDFMTHMDSLPD